ncbi:MAG: hypothetical protein JO236_20875 [Mycobacterium sp.]|uniref:hypothetical protein n=1 Tax=Mycobacterium sp. TaxID=1785 RepID=UPI001ED6F1DB|nr:hypothetical protein [Mycobacterium sp.]MBW0019978.1 hypothetical protein [Mycobacterium sp.]
MVSGPWGYLTALAAASAVTCAACVFVYIGRLENRTPAPLGEKVGAHKTVLAKLRKREPLTQDEYDYARELVADARSPLAYAIPATLFSTGCFYVVGCLYELQVHGGNPSFRTFIGGLPMLGSINIFAQLRRVALLNKRLKGAEIAADAGSVRAYSAQSKR